MSRLLMFNKAAIAIVWCLLTLGCTTGPSVQTDDSILSEDEYRKTCRMMSFDNDYANYSVERRELLVLRLVHGKISARSGFQWGENGVLFQIRRLNESRTYKTRTDQEGNFLVPGLEPGKYCYLVAVEGWQSEGGRVLVTENAPEGSSLDIVLLLDG